MERRNFIKTAALSTTAAMLPLAAQSAVDQQKSKPFVLNPKPLKIGIMTYTIAKDWDIETIIKNLTETKYQTVELRTTHAHKIEVDLTAAQRADVKKRFKDSPLEVISMASLDFSITHLTLRSLKRILRERKNIFYWLRILEL